MLALVNISRSNGRPFDPPGDTKPARQSFEEGEEGGKEGMMRRERKREERERGK